MDADASMDPHRYQRNHLHRAEPGPMQPLGDEDGVVIDRNVQRALGYACADDVKHQQKGNAQAERDLCQYTASKPQRAANIDRPQRIAVMDDESGNKNGCAEPRAPRIHQESKNGFRIVDRDQQKPVRGEMTDDKSEHDEPAAQPKPGAPHTEIGIHRFVRTRSNSPAGNDRFATPIFPSPEAYSWHSLCTRGTMTA